MSHFAHLLISLCGGREGVTQVSTFGSVWSYLHSFYCILRRLNTVSSQLALTNQPPVHQLTIIVKQQGYRQSCGLKASEGVRSTPATGTDVSGDGEV
ncbi:hypothetical protein Pcinc_011137 [Petrolisthes cinctipes]|uniref:Uncharacterized protein n=1 Tax=Petrolisthes cinctipes TaxID=88211 RepID=A0AAE1G3Q0_PETCI|nr:hypothetical protein Pcinc_011137 [Petrolisthes cinctipes]